ncbi:Soluble lytic murein transglycosylase precursor [Roseivivax jejudonensis]|uniref:Soluble lytic murein transglycosylase n=1 Tax=Roseivivax jejudonensis TaxID=1529041 RepID=A0A1X7A7T5_9RHOB|nr:lytic transglycosylase domain-containing protein [Roseivivax jejudonensis]SLN72442.1 Soluble lytic murein transglycosylase precursor [Roseivivax jejudonensis]
MASFAKFAAVAAALAIATPAMAEFTFKRVTPPAAGTKKRITVQVAPRANPAVLPPPERRAPDESDKTTVSTAAVAPSRPGAVGRYGWFWDAVGAGLDGAGPGRLEPALSQLARAPSGETVATPRLQALQDMARRHGRDILAATIGTEVSPALALAVMAVESGGRSDAVSGAGAQGLMQLMPATAERFGVKNSFDPAQNIRGGITFLDFLMKKFDGDPMLVLAGYNAGENSIAPHDGVPPYAETRDYVPKVLAAFETARGLCLTPPMFLSDGCVFHGM